MPNSCVHRLLLEMYERNGVLSIPQEALKRKLWVTGRTQSERMAVWIAYREEI